MKTGNSEKPFQGGKKTRLRFKKDFRTCISHAIAGAFCKSVKRADEIDGTTYPIESRADAPYEHDKRILGKSTVRFAIGSVSK